MYQKVTQEADGQLLGRYLMESKYEGAETDFDVLTEYAVYPHEAGVFIAEHTPTINAFGTFATLENAFEAVRNKVNSKIELSKTLEEAGAKFGEIVTKNSLDERYRDKQVEQKPKTHEQVKNKYSRVEREKIWSCAMIKTHARLNAKYNRFETHK